MSAINPVVMVPIRQIYDAIGGQACFHEGETCHFYVAAPTPNFMPSCNHCQRGIPNNKPHRLCPVFDNAANA